MAFYIVRRALSVIPVMIVVAAIVFFLLRLAPGDPASIIAGEQATLQDVERVRVALGLNEPILVQFFNWIRLLATGDLGTSLVSGRPVSEAIGQRIWPSVNIALFATLLTVIFSLPLGVVAAWRHRTTLDHAVMAFSVLGFSVPVFVIGYVLMQAFALELRWLPVQGYIAPSDSFTQFLARAILPSAALAVIYMALVTRMTRASMLSVLQEDYIRTARSKGVGERSVLFRHALRNAAIPVVTTIGTGFAMLLSGVVVVESVFNLPGVGRLAVDSVLSRDYPVIQGLMLVTSMTYVFINLIVDLSYTIFDPRIRY